MTTHIQFPIDKLNESFIAYLQTNFQGSVLEINIVSEKDIEIKRKRRPRKTVTEKRLLQAIENVKNNKFVEYSIDELDNETLFFKNVIEKEKERKAC